jgi:hypothetical protein
MSDAPVTVKGSAMFVRLLVCWVLALASPGTLAQTAKSDAASVDDSATPRERSPWLALPLLQSNPKLGTCAGVLGGYMQQFDAKSRPSIFAMQGQDSDTDSIIAGGFGRNSFDEDRQRLIAGLLYGYVKNDYDALARLLDPSRVFRRVSAPVLVGSQIINGGLLLVVMWLAEQWRGGALIGPVRATALSWIECTSLTLNRKISVAPMMDCSDDRNSR